MAKAGGRFACGYVVGYTATGAARMLTLHVGTFDECSAIRKQAPVVADGERHAASFVIVKVDE